MTNKMTNKIFILGILCFTIVSCSKKKCVTCELRRITDASVIRTSTECDRDENQATLRASNNLGDAGSQNAVIWCNNSN